MNKDRISEVCSLMGDINTKLTEQQSMLARVEALFRVIDRSKPQYQVRQAKDKDPRQWSPNERIRQLASILLPPGAIVAIISKGDDSLLKLEGRTGWHFPQGENGVYAGYYPANSAEAIIHLEQLRKKGAGFLLIPSTSFWWLAFYAEFKDYLTLCYRLAAYQDDACAIFALNEGASRTYWLDVRCHGAPQITAKPKMQAKQIKSVGKDLSAASRPPKVKLSKKLDDKLWGGFSRSAIADLRALKADPAESSKERAEAAYSLARWHGAEGQFETALREVEDMRTLHPGSAKFSQQFMLEALFLCRLGRAREAWALLEEKKTGFDPSVELMLANTWNSAVTGETTPEAEARVLAHINAVYRHFGLSTIEKRDPTKPLSIDNLCGTEAGPRNFDPDGKVSVIVPVYNAADTIVTALTSLAEQTWENLEVLVVDDASTDNSVEIISQFCASDSRFRLIQQEKNGGSYVARNRALVEATGDFVTVHDADDWSHPERIRLHVDDLRHSPLPFNISDWARATPDLFFWGASRPHHKLVFLNISSFFFRRSLVDITGQWDQARVSADAEFINRVRRIFEVKRPISILSECPLVFGRLAETSLTRQYLTHVATLRNGIRREYQEAADFWHLTMEPADIRARGLQRRPPYFPTPPAIRPDPSAPPLDALFVADWNLAGGAVESAMNMVHAAQCMGLKCGLLHYRSYHLDVIKPLKRAIRRFAWDNDIRVVAPGETLKAHNVIVTYPAILDHVMDRFPKIEHQWLVVVVNQMAERDTAGRDVAYDPTRVRQHLTEFFGHEGNWAPISNWIRRLMVEDPRYPRPHGDIWTPLIDVDSWRSNTPSWRRGGRERPVVGRHGRDHVLKWPGKRDALRAAYCAEMPCETRFLGGAGHAKALLGQWPSNWRDNPYGSRDVREFLVELDFFVHFPHENYIEEFGRAPMEAMAAGLPVILPPVFRETFGDAALYAEPEDVWPTIERLWRDQDGYLARAKAGRDFVLANCGWDQLPARLERLAMVESRDRRSDLPALAQTSAQ